jgi:hypothetical protein
MITQKELKLREIIFIERKKLMSLDNPYIKFIRINMEGLEGLELDLWCDGNEAEYKHVRRLTKRYLHAFLQIVNITRLENI